MPTYDDEEFDNDEDDLERRERFENKTDEELDDDIARLEDEINDLQFLLYLTTEELTKLDKNDPEAVTKALALVRERARVERQERKLAQSASAGAPSAANQPAASEKRDFPLNDIPLAFQETPRCQHAKANNQPCGSPAMKSRRYCYFHDQARARSKKQIRLPVLEDHRAIQMAITRICQGITDQAIDAKVGSTLLYGLQVASTAVPKMVAKKSSRKER